ncbi:hypothetical protein B6U74_04535 [Candidatus Bathyarchaeota archaeon ex4484_205]|nr:MAG: hypothetical protein B6U74_04535 [Candidatus Bathyarchaeota archaeon ex4484_205]
MLYKRKNLESGMDRKYLEWTVPLIIFFLSVLFGLRGTNLALGLFLALLTYLSLRIFRYKNRLRSRDYIVAATGSAFSTILGFLPPLFLTPWGMRIDFVALPWIIIWLYSGLETALLSAVLSIPMVGYLEPGGGGWIGGIMKFLASIWMIVIPELLSRGKHSGLRFRVGLVAAIIVRSIAMIIFNYYFAIPLFFGLDPSLVVTQFERGLACMKIIGFSGVVLFIIEIIVWNTVQGFIDVFFSLLIYRGIAERQKLE